MELHIETLTPLWTGGVEKGKVDRIHETGILGSLRWWYEAIVRGLGGKACDPSKGTCKFTVKSYEESQTGDDRQRLRDAGLCDVCQVFGATGWRRRFRLSVVDNAAPDSSVVSEIKIVRKDENNKEHTSTWFFPKNNGDKPLSGSLTLQIQRLSPDFEPEVIAGLIQFVADWAAIGARTQMGFGVIKIVGERIDTRPLLDWLEPVADSNAHPDLPSLRNIFLARIAPKNGGQFSGQDTFNLKYDLRRLFANDKDLRHFIMGTVRGQRMAAKVKMSRPYNDHREMRVWGWIPEQANVYRDSWNRGAVVDAIYQHVSANYNLQVWREMNSDRDTVEQNNNDALAFLRDLLAIKEENDAA